MLKRYFFFLFASCVFPYQAPTLKKNENLFVFLLRIFGPVIVSVIDF